MGKNACPDPSTVLNNRCLTFSNIQKTKYSTDDYFLWAWLITVQYGPIFDFFQICRVAVLGENGGEYLFQLFTNSNGNNFYVGPLESLLLYS